MFFFPACTVLHSIGKERVLSVTATTTWAPHFPVYFQRCLIWLVKNAKIMLG
jgi:hypothetical protein